MPTGYGSVSLQASINGIALGDAWSKKTTYAESTEHAEDAVVDYVQSCVFAISLGSYPSNATSVMKEVIDSMASTATMKLIINNLTASPCSDKHGTNKKNGCCWLCRKIDRIEK